MIVFHSQEESNNWLRMQGNNKVLHSACAACKHQRKKCNEKCILSPYFPSSRSCEFDAVHKVFGVSNITKLVKNVRVEDRRMVVDSLIWEACCRQRDPIQGTYGEYTKICHEYEKVFNELQIIRDQNHLIMQLPSHLGVKSSEKHKPERVDNVLNYLQGNKNNVIIDSNIYNNYCPIFLQDYLELENMKPEVIPSFQQHSQPYYVAVWL
ncbi:PREDICTED: LOB domain-containing protein 22-like [Lupinus angustifolius]|uniref:LOB domain-containing protein 22-like n=1 Tax=Lupinus angustifolius TaxID=3871 RepID=UPI00092E35A3|nr:PREDICTED: LOB domain-containing protein 22-like [Lupinus angustifolius]